MTLALVLSALAAEPPARASSSVERGACDVVALVRWFHQIPVDCEDTTLPDAPARVDWSLGADARASLEAFITAYDGPDRTRRYGIQDDGGRLSLAVLAVRDGDSWIPWRSVLDVSLGEPDVGTTAELCGRLYAATGARVPHRPPWVPWLRVDPMVSVSVGPNVMTSGPPEPRLPIASTLRATLHARHPEGWDLVCSSPGPGDAVCEARAWDPHARAGFAERRLPSHRTGRIARPGEPARLPSEHARAVSGR